MRIGRNPPKEARAPSSSTGSAGILKRISNFFRGRSVKAAENSGAHLDSRDQKVQYQGLEEADFVPIEKRKVGFLERLKELFLFCCGLGSTSDRDDNYSYGEPYEDPYADPCDDLSDSYAPDLYTNSSDELVTHMIGLRNAWDDLIYGKDSDENRVDYELDDDWQGCNLGEPIKNMYNLTYVEEDMESLDSDQDQDEWDDDFSSYYDDDSPSGSFHDELSDDSLEDFFERVEHTKNAFRSAPSSGDKFLIPTLSTIKEED